MTAYDSFVQAYEWNSIKQAVCRAYEVVDLFDLSRTEIEELALSESIAKASWYTAVYLFIDTRDKRLPFYRRCQAEDRMRQAWRQFQCTFVCHDTRLPSLPALPEQ